jgi:hypothetical protein
MGDTVKLKHTRMMRRAIKMIRDLVEGQGVDVVTACNRVLFNTPSIRLGLNEIGQVSDEAIAHYNKGKTQ